MRVQLDEDEVRAMLSTVMRHMLEDVGLSDDDRAALKRWRSDEMRLGREPMRALLDKLNVDVARVIKAKERGAIQKHDWV